MNTQMIASKPGVAVSYLITASTAVAGGATTVVQEQAQVIISQPLLPVILGFPLSEVALIVGIGGTIATVIFQYLNYKNNKKRINSGIPNKK